MRRVVIVCSTVIVALFVLPLIAAACTGEMVTGLPAALTIATRSFGTVLGTSAFAAGVAAQQEIDGADACRILGATLLVVIPYVACLLFRRIHAWKPEAGSPAPA